MFWSTVEKIIGERIPKCVQEILTSCAYTSLLSLKSISEDNESCSTIEEYINEYCGELIHNLNCSHAEIYKNQTQFKLLPGHRGLILLMSKIIAKSIDEQHDNQCEEVLLCQLIEKSPHLSVLLKELVKTAVTNGQRPKNNAQYSDIIRYFSTYLFITCGRASYTILYENLPIPSITTIRKYSQFLL